MTLFVLPLIACAVPPAADPSATVADPVPEDPSEHVYEADAPPSVSLSPEAIGQAVEGFFDTVFTVSGAAPVTLHDELFDQGDATCPYASPVVEDGYDDTLSGALWFGGCTAESGASYDGYGYRLAYRGYEEAGQVYDGDAVFGQAEMVTPAGERFTLGGTAYDLAIDVPSEQYTSWINLVEGTFAWDGESRLETWLDGDLAPTLTTQAFYSALYDGQLLLVDGGLTGLGGDIDTVVTDGVTFISRSLGNGCPEEPGGVISLRDPSGEWVDLLFDGPSEFGEVVDVAACDGCGTLVHRGEAIGTACAELSHLLDFTTRPW